MNLLQKLRKNSLAITELPEQTADWPPLFTLKKSPRARHVKLKASVTHGLELVVPMRFNQKHIPRILAENRLWIQKQLAQIARDIHALDVEVLPDTISLQAIEQTWKVSYATNTSKKIRVLTRAHQELILLGNIADKNLCKKTLVKWVKDQAKIHLPARLEEISLQTGLAYQGVTIRNQRSRWGSCSSSKVINLNYKLIFLPKAWMDYIIIHELCHTMHMNHSAKFWRLVALWDANWKEHSRAARRADKHIPGWATDFAT